jgi:phospholipid/cholesterol/gamma-HCH transport system substrate-binding protein
VGTVISAALIVGLVGTLWLQGVNWGRPVTVVEVWVRTASGLMKGNPVVFRGVPIGRVADLTLDPSGGFVRISVELQGAVQIQDDSRGLLAPQSFFGDWQLEIISLSRLPRVDYYEVPAGYQENGVRVIGGYAMPDISELTLVAAEISENIAVLTDRFDRAFSEETAEALSQVVHNVEQLSVEINDMIQQQAATFERVSTDVERAANELGQAAAAGRTTLERLDGILAGGEIERILANVETASLSLTDLVGDFHETRGEISGMLARADTSFQSMGRVAQRIESGQGTLGRLLMSDTLAVLAESAVIDLQLLFQDIKENPGRYLRLSIF